MQAALVVSHREIESRRRIPAAKTHWLWKAALPARSMTVSLAAVRPVWQSSHAPSDRPAGKLRIPS